MNRKTIIRCVVAFVVLGGIAMTFWEIEDKGEVRIVFAGTAPDGSHSPLFTMTNSSNYYFHSRVYLEQPTNGVWTVTNPRHCILELTVDGRADYTFVYDGNVTDRWRLIVHSDKEIPASTMDVLRITLANWAKDCDFDRFGAWMDPVRKTTVVYSPEMLGNRPAPLEQK